MRLYDAVAYSINGGWLQAGQAWERRMRGASHSRTFVTRRGELVTCTTSAR